MLSSATSSSSELPRTRFRLRAAPDLTRPLGRPLTPVPRVRTVGVEPADVPTVRLSVPTTFLGRPLGRFTGKRAGWATSGGRGCPWFVFPLT